MKSKFFLSALLAFFASTHNAQAQAPVPTPPVPDTRVRVALQSVSCSDTNDVVGNDEFYVLSSFAGAAISFDKNNLAVMYVFNQPQNTSVTKPFKIKEKQTRTWGEDGVVFDAVVPKGGEVLGGLHAYEQDETKDWNKRGEWVQALNSTVYTQMRSVYLHNLQYRISSSDLIRWSDDSWEQLRSIFRGTLDGANPDDALGNARTFFFNVSGPASETFDWQVKTSDTSYTVRYLITRTPVEKPTSTPTPTPVVTPPISTPPSIPEIPSTPAEPPGGTVGGGFNNLNIFAVRVDSVQPDAAQKNLEVDCTIRNRAATNRLFNGSIVRLALTDADGIGIWNVPGMVTPDASSKLMAGNTELAPKATMKVRYLFKILDDVAPLQTISLWEQFGNVKTVDVSVIEWPKTKPATVLSGFALQFGGSGYQKCGDNLEVRFDGFCKARDGYGEAFFDFKNIVNTSTLLSALEITPSSLALQLWGTAKPIGHEMMLYRANANTAVPILQHLVIVPGGEAHLRYRFKTPVNFTPNKLTMSETRSKTTLEWSLQ